MQRAMRRQRPAVFLDRDGVINEDRRDYVRSWEAFSFLPGALEALGRLYEAGGEIYVVTNQAGVGKGLMSERAVQDILWRMRLIVRQHGGRIHGVAYCPHTEEAGCACRKPKPGMLQRLAAKYGLDISRSVIVGDSWRDVTAGQLAGCRTILVHTSGPERAVQELARCVRPPDYEAADLAAAAEMILSRPEFRELVPKSPLWK